MNVYLYDAVRTPRGKARPDGGLAAVAPQELVKQLIGALDERCGPVSPHCGQLVLGCVGQIGAQGGNIALHAKLHAGLPESSAAYTLNNYCVSGLTAIGLAATAVANKVTTLALAGGVECMSRVPFMADQAAYYTDAQLPKPARFVPVAVAADLLAHKQAIGRSALDAVTFTSHARAVAGEQRYNRSRIAVHTNDGAIALARDECVRPATTREQLAALKPAFGELAAQYRDALEGASFPALHAIAHAPPMVDGAALAVIGPKPEQVSPKPRARILAYAERGGDARDSLLAGFTAMDAALQQAGLKLSDIDRIEFMEAFAVVPALFLREYDVDPDKVNVAGGHLAKGHPMGATGAILVSSLLDVLQADDAMTGLVVATGASGIGAAMVLERVS